MKKVKATSSLCNKADVKVEKNPNRVPNLAGKRDIEKENINQGEGKQIVDLIEETEVKGVIKDNDPIKQGNKRLIVSNENLPCENTNANVNDTNESEEQVNKRFKLEI